MATKTMSVEIKGQGLGLLMHRFPLEPIEALEKKSRQDQAELAAYRTPSPDGILGSLYIPGSNLQRALVAGAAYSKGRGRATLQKPVAACVEVEPEWIILTPQSYEIDSRPVVIPATKGRVIRHRPWFPEWGAQYSISYDDLMLTEEQLRRIVDDTGRNVGVLDYRPEHKGPFGRFIIVEWR